MEWVRDFHANMSRWIGRSGVLDGDRTRAAYVEKCCGPGPRAVLELGAGQGGAAAAMAALGHDVTAVDFNPVDADWARDLAREPGAGSLRFVEADFYGFDAGRRFDYVCYWDGFGVGSDEDQRRLLARIASHWLAGDGVALIDVFGPWRWMNISGTVERYPARPGAPWQVDMIRTRTFDPVSSRYVDRWEPEDGSAGAITQTLRCYTPADFRLLLAGTGLEIVRLEEPWGPAIDPDATHAYGAGGGDDRIGNLTGYFAVLRHAR